MGGQQRLAPLSLSNIGTAKPLRDGNQWEMCLEDESRERETEGEREKGEPLKAPPSACR